MHPHEVLRLGAGGLAVILVAVAYLGGGAVLAGELERRSVPDSLC